MLLRFPFLFGGTFIEGEVSARVEGKRDKFPFLFGGTFIEGKFAGLYDPVGADFPSFSEGLSLRDIIHYPSVAVLMISLPFRRDFH